MGTLAEIREVNGPLLINRYNMYPAAAVNGAAGPGVSSAAGHRLDGPPGRQGRCPECRLEWTDMAYLEIQAGNTAMTIFGFSVLVVFLVLAAQYESWSLPLAVILVVPMCLLGAIFGVPAPGAFEFVSRQLHSPIPGAARRTSTSSRRSASSSSSAWPARMRF